MKPIYPPYDFIVISILTIVVGIVVRSILIKYSPKNSKKLLLPFAIAYIFSSVILAFVWDELPIKLYGPSKTQTQVISDGPNIGAGLMEGMLYLNSVLLNFAIWVLCILLILKSLISNKTDS